MIFNRTESNAIGGNSCADFDLIHPSFCSPEIRLVVGLQSYRLLLFSPVDSFCNLKMVKNNLDNSRKTNKFIKIK